MTDEQIDDDYGEYATDGTTLCADCQNVETPAIIRLGRQMFCAACAEKRLNWLIEMVRRA